jgi:hypothetical protein
MPDILMKLRSDLDDAERIADEGLPLVCAFIKTRH